MGVIYGLFDPRKPLWLWEVRYIGRTARTTHVRLRDHVWMAESGKKTPLYDWMRKLFEGDVKPHIQVLEAVNDDASGNRETIWIAEGRRQGWRLLNLADGGAGLASGFRHTDEQRKRLSEIVIQRHIDDPGIAERKRAGQLRRFEDPMAREVMSKAASDWIASLDQGDTWCDDCGAGPFKGAWGLIHHTKHCILEKQPEMCPDCDAGPFDGPHGVVMHRMHKHQPKEELMCDCGAGPFKGSHGLGIHKGTSCQLNKPC